MHEVPGYAETFGLGLEDGWERTFTKVSLKMSTSNSFTTSPMKALSSARTGMEAVRASNMDFDDGFKPFIRDRAACSFAYYAANRDRHLIHP